MLNKKVIAFVLWFVLMAILASYAYAGSCPSNFNAHYGYIKKVRLISKVKNTSCMGSVIGKITMERVPVSHVDGGVQWKAKGRKEHYQFTELSRYHSCLGTQCRDISFNEFLNSGGKAEIDTYYDKDLKIKIPLDVWLIVE